MKISSHCGFVFSFLVGLFLGFSLLFSSVPVLHAEDSGEDSGEASGGVGWIGLGIGLVPPSIRSVEDFAATHGVFVYYVVLGSPAENAGLLPGDVILQVETNTDANRVENPDQVTGILREMSPRDSIRLHVTRFGDKQSYGVTLEQLPAAGEFEQVRSRVWPGFSVVKLTGAVASRLEMPRVPGSFVIGKVEVGSPAFNSGLRTGDIISNIEGVAVNDFEEFYRIINNSDTSLSIRIYRRGRSGEVELSRKPVFSRSGATE